MRSETLRPIAAILAWLVVVACQRPEPAALVIRDVTVIPMTGSGPLSPRTVVVRGGRIERIMAAAETAPEAARTIDGTGRFLIPSLVDAHVHVCDSGDFLTYLAYGIGLVRNMEGMPFQLHLRDAIDAGLMIGPRLVTAGPYTNAPRIADPRAAPSAVAEQARLGYDAIKIHGPMPIPTLRALGEAAREAGLPVIGHVPRDQVFAEVMETGAMDEVSHAEEYLYTHFPNLPGADEDDALAAAVAASLEGGIALTPTLTTFRSILRQVEDVEAAVAAVPARALGPFAVRAFSLANNRYARRFDASDTTWFRSSLDLQTRLVGDLARAGVPILTGSDANNPASGPGYSLHEEIELLASAGLGARRALEAATTGGWRELTGDPAAGVVAEGALAELLLLEADPLEDVRNVGAMAGIVRAGRWLAVDSLNAALDSLHATRSAEQPFVDRLWDNTLEDALPWLEAAAAEGGAPAIRADTWRCQAERAVRDGVPEVALEAIVRANALEPGSVLGRLYEAEILLELGRVGEAMALWSDALAEASGLRLARVRTGGA